MENVKSIINCETREFFKLLNTLRQDIDEYFKVTKLNEIIYASDKLPEGLTGEEKEKAARDLYSKRFNKVVEACFGNNLDMTYNLLINMYFGNEDYVNGLDQIEIINLVFSIFTNPKVIPFFTIYFHMN